jgi:hypothetical protein
MAKSTPIQLSSIDYHPYAECDDCPATWPIGPSSRPAAKDHVRYQGHRVRVILTKVSLWGPK